MFTRCVGYVLYCCWVAEPPCTRSWVAHRGHVRVPCRQSMCTFVRFRTVGVRKKKKPNALTTCGAPVVKPHLKTRTGLINTCSSLAGRSCSGSLITLLPYLGLLRNDIVGDRKTTTALSHLAHCRNEPNCDPCRVIAAPVATPSSLGGTWPAACFLFLTSFSGTRCDLAQGMQRYAALVTSTRGQGECSLV